MTVVDFCTNNHSSDTASGFYSQPNIPKQFNRTELLLNKNEKRINETGNGGKKKKKKKSWEELSELARLLIKFKAKYLWKTSIFVIDRWGTSRMNYCCKKKQCFKLTEKKDGELNQGNYSKWKGSHRKFRNFFIYICEKGKSFWSVWLLTHRPSFFLSDRAFRIRYIINDWIWCSRFK